MKTIQLNLYGFAELSEKAKAVALKEFADINVYDNWYDSTVEDFKTIAETMGIRVDAKRTYFRGFYSQGDGSCFSAGVDLPRLIQSVQNKGWQAYAPNIDFDFPMPEMDTRLINLICAESFDLSPKIISKERWYSVEADLDEYLPRINHRYDRIEAELEKLEEWLQSVANILNRYLYKSLQAEYEYQTCDGAVIVAIEANEYQFTADGRSAIRIKNLAINT